MGINSTNYGLFLESNGPVHYFTFENLKPSLIVDSCDAELKIPTITLLLVRTTERELELELYSVNSLPLQL